jgi:polyphenol oxidase
MQSVLRSQKLEQLGFAHGFSTRAGGVSQGPYASLNLGRSVGDDLEHVAENHRRFAGWVGYAPDALFELSQVHGASVLRVAQGEDPTWVRGERGDALVGTRGAAVGVRTADCVPLLIADPVTRHVAAVHAGWRGVVAEVAPVAVRALCEAAGAPASRLWAAIFPHIRSCCFEVGEDVAEQLGRGQPGVAVARGASKPHVALDALIASQLRAAGLPAEQLDDVPGCTRCDAQQFFSFRRDGQASGRHLTVIISG